jgi:hypothetical protein
MKCDDGSNIRFYAEKFEDTKRVIRSSKSKKNRQHNGRKNKQRSTKQYTE